MLNSTTTLSGTPRSPVHSTSRRKRERLRLELPVRVRLQTSPDECYEEITRLLDVTPLGARFSLARKVNRGCLLQLTMNLPRRLRFFDQAEDQYRVWAMVRNTRPFVRQDTGRLRFECGVAFVGKQPPQSYFKDPTKCYMPRPAPGETQTQVETQANCQTGTQRCEDTRLHLPLEVTVELFDELGEPVGREETVTENISRRGAAVPSTLLAKRGMYVRLTSHRQQITVLAAVRASRVGADLVPRIHLEFLDCEWPLDGVG